MYSKEQDIQKGLDLIGEHIPYPASLEAQKEYLLYQLAYHDNVIDVYRCIGDLLILSDPMEAENYYRKCSEIHFERNRCHQVDRVRFAARMEKLFKC